MYIFFRFYKSILNKENTLVLNKCTSLLYEGRYMVSHEARQLREDLKIVLERVALIRQP